MELLNRVRWALRRHSLAGPHTRVLAAVSGGADSVALAHVLSELSRAGELKLVGLAHFDHQLRPRSASDAAFVADVAIRLAVPFSEGRGDVAGRSRAYRESLEVAARTLRLSFLEQVRAEVAADVIAFGHTRDDQAETFLLRMLRGAGSRGLGSMHPRRGTTIRPLLQLRRAELRDYLARNDVPFVTDESNADVGVPRNRVRHELIPLLEARFNPSIVDVLANAATLLRDEAQIVREQALEWLHQSASRVGPRVLVPIAPLLLLPMGHQRGVLHQVLHTSSRGRAGTFADVERALDVVAGRVRTFDAPGLLVQRIAGDLVLVPRSPGFARGAQAPPFWCHPLPDAGELQMPESGQSIEVVNERASARPLGSHDPKAVSVQVAASDLPLAVRSRRPGDRFSPPGMGGRSKSLQDFFVDRKVPRDARWLVPIVVTATDKIVWVAGHQVDARYAAREPAQPVITLRLKGLGGRE